MSYKTEISARTLSTTCDISLSVAKESQLFVDIPDDLTSSCPPQAGVLWRSSQYFVNSSTMKMKDYTHDNPRVITNSKRVNIS